MFTLICCSHEFSGPDFSSAWLTSARLARKANFSHPAFDAVIRASQLSDIAAPVENAKLLWKEGYHRKAMQSLESVITGNAFQSRNAPAPEESFATNTTAGRQRQQANPVGAKAHLQLAKWLDQTGQTQSEVIVQRYRKVTFLWNRWEGGHYHLGKHYNKLLESEKAKDHPKQAQTFITGETAKLVIENYLRSLGYGAKYIYQTLPRVLTLWLELGSDVEKPCDTRYGSDFSFRQHIDGQRKKLFAAVMAQVKKYIDRLPPFIFYTALAQIVARVCHTNPTVYSSLVDIISKVVFAHPQQALWTLMALTKSKSQTERANRGTMCVTKVIEMAAKSGSDAAKTEMRTLINNGERLSDQLLQVCDRDVAGKHGVMSLSKDFKFNHQRATSCRLVIPMEKTLLATLPTGIDTVRGHKGFSKDTVTISKFLDDTTIMNSLIRPRRVSILGSDGKIYSIMCKPKDDLRKDQRLLDFNSMISRILKKDAECSKRRLYIKTYAVTPLNETCGLIEWVEGMRTLRDILLELYQARGITPQYKRLAELQKQAGENPSKASIFTNDLLSQFPPVFHQWFVEAFPEPTAWFEARLRYTRSCAAMSMIGHVLGLGDRHGENILFEEAQGGTLHVDFNCLFDKGKTFEYPERVPFRLTHNMVDAFGSYGYDGPFRKSCELTLGILRQHEDTLMTILETFLYDPTTDFIGQKKRAANNIPVTPEGVLESIRSKVRGVLPMESVPLSVEGCVDYLIKQATDPYNLTRMYIGWCSFL